MAATKPQEKSAGSLLFQMLFSHFGMFFVIALYTVFGAHMFVKYESPAENERYIEKVFAAEQVREALSYSADLFWFYGGNHLNKTMNETKTTIRRDLLRIEHYILQAISNHNYDGEVETWSEDWTFMNAVLFAMTIITTIGYGNISPVTYAGQMFCIAYALIGCPLFLVFLANLGDSMAKGFIYIYSRCCCRICRSRRYLSELPKNVSRRHRKHVIDDQVGNEEYMPTSRMFVPITINLVILHVYFFLGALLFKSWEDNWSRTGSFYFTFVTLSTIGFGDYVPGSSFSDKPDNIATTMKLLICVTYIVLGMALLSMCINLMQEQIVEKCRWASKKMGLTKNNDQVSEPKPMDKRKDSLLPVMENSDGPSPFRRPDATTPLSGIPEEGEGKIWPPGLLPSA